MGSRLEALEEALGHRFSRPRLLRQALTHSSTARGPAERARTNERLEFLGDRVLALVVAEFLYERFPDEDEGALALRHVALVRRETLARVAADIGLAPYVILSAGEDESGGRENPGLLADTCEAVIAALFLDGGWEAAAAFVRARWEPLAVSGTPPKDAKTELQEWSQARGRGLPTYRVVDRHGPAHEPSFLVEAVVDGRPPVTATGPSKRAAEQSAAESLLDAMAEAERDG